MANKKSITFRADNDLANLLEEVAQGTGTGVTELIVECLRDRLPSLAKEKAAERQKLSAALLKKLEHSKKA